MDGVIGLLQAVGESGLGWTVPVVVGSLAAYPRIKEQRRLDKQAAHAIRVQEREWHDSERERQYRQKYVESVVSGRNTLIDYHLKRLEREVTTAESLPHNLRLRQHLSEERKALQHWSVGVLQDDAAWQGETPPFFEYPRFSQ